MTRKFLIFNDVKIGRIPPFDFFDSLRCNGDLQILSSFAMLYSNNVDNLVKIQKRRRSRGGGSPELLDLTGFPLSRE
jgi:hypothetical protein